LAMTSHLPCVRLAGLAAQFDFGRRELADGAIHVPIVRPSGKLLSSLAERLAGTMKAAG
jgi:hypothetical protein